MASASSKKEETGGSLTEQKRTKTQLRTWRSNYQERLRLMMDEDFNPPSPLNEVLESHSHLIQEEDTSVTADEYFNLLEDLGKAIYNIAYFTPLENFESVVDPIVEITRLIVEGSQFSENGNLAANRTTITHVILDMLGEDFRDNFNGRRRVIMDPIKRLIFKLLRFDDVCHMDKYANTLLHILMSMVLLSKDEGSILKITKVLIRYGCPIDDINCNDRTASEILRDFDPNNETYQELAAVLAPSTTVLRLEEIASRALLRSKIPYEKVLPARLCEIVEGECMQPVEYDSETGSSDSETGSSDD